MANVARLLCDYVVDIIANNVPTDEATAFLVERANLPLLPEEQIQMTKVRVYPDGIAGEGLQDRGCELLEYAINVCVVKSVRDPQDVEEVDVLVDLAEQINFEISKFKFYQLDNTATEPDVEFHIVAELEPPYEADPLYDQVQLKEGVFVSRTIFTYRVQIER